MNSYEDYGFPFIEVYSPDYVLLGTTIYVTLVKDGI